MTQEAKQGTYTAVNNMSSITATPLVFNRNRNEFDVTVDGVTATRVNLPEGTYDNLETLRATLEQTINNAGNLVDAGKSVSVTYDADNRLQFTSNSYGDDSHVSFSNMDTYIRGHLGLKPGYVNDVANIDHHTCSGFLPSNKPCINHQVQLYCSSYFPDLDQKALLASASMIF